MRERLRWRIAYLLDRLPGQCWVDLVSWALDGSSIRRRVPWAPDSACRADTATCGFCFCGKFQRGEGR